MQFCQFILIVSGKAKLFVASCLYKEFDLFVVLIKNFLLVCLQFWFVAYQRVSNKIVASEVLYALLGPRLLVQPVLKESRMNFHSQNTSTNTAKTCCPVHPTKMGKIKTLEANPDGTGPQIWEDASSSSTYVTRQAGTQFSVRSMTFRTIKHSDLNRMSFVQVL